MTESNLVYRGKSKDVYEVTEGLHTGKYRLVFTDRATGYMENGRPVFDPGRDVVVGEIPGKGEIACRFATHFFRLLQDRGIPTHFIETVSGNEMIVEPAVPLCSGTEASGFPGSVPLSNLEFTWRNNGTGSFWRRYPFVRPCRNLHTLVEAWTKGDSDILITFEAIEETGAMTGDEIARSVSLVKDVAGIVSREFTSKGLHVIDGKFELGRLKHGDGSIVLIDEISPDVLRVCRGYTPDQRGDCAVHGECTVTACSHGVRTIRNRNKVSADELLKLFL